MQGADFTRGGEHQKLISVPYRNDFRNDQETLSRYNDDQIKEMNEKSSTEVPH